MSYRGLWPLLFILIEAPQAKANFYDMYRSDYTKTAACQVIGSACASDNDPENSFFQNPAALVSGSTSFIIDAGYGKSKNLEPGMKGGNDVSEINYMGGFAKPGKTWGLGLAMSGKTNIVISRASIVDDRGNSQTIGAKDRADTVKINLIFGAKLSEGWSIGSAILGLYYREKLDIDGAAEAEIKPIDKIPPPAIALGFLYSSKYFRFGTWGRTPSTYYFHQKISVPTIAYDLSIKEDVGLHFPWTWSSGISLMPWGDKTTLLMDVNFIGTTNQGYVRTYDTFASTLGEKSLRKKGRTAVIEPHIGWRSPFSNNSPASYYLGAYYETSRWEGLSGRTHLTGALAYRFFNFVEVLLGGDIAKDYFSLALTVH